MHKEEASKGFYALSEADNVKIVKMLYHRGTLSFEDLLDLIGCGSVLLSDHLKQLLQSGLIKEEKQRYQADRVKIDELMRFISTPCGCSLKEGKKGLSKNLTFEK